jgi:sec-independent protein translocase protein TatB
MFDIAIGELLVIVIVAVVVIGPKDLPLAMRTAGRWIGKVRRVSAHFRSGIDAMVREAELEEMEKKWRAQNEEIMRRTAPPAGSEPAPSVMVGPPPGDDVATAPTQADTPPADPPPAPPPDASDDPATGLAASAEGGKHV